jgi:DNA replication and repair protein RecF
MRLSHLSLTNFRNLVSLESDLPEGVTILLGANAQGKTSLLEAIYYLVGANSRHASNDRQLINFLSLESPQPFARIVAEIQREASTQHIEIRIILENQRLKKEIIVNGSKRRTRDLVGTFNVILFLPRDMLVVEGSPQERRNYLNSALSQTDTSYALNLTEYSKVLAQRNALLKQLKDRRTNTDELEYWDKKIADLGAKLMHSRAQGLSELKTQAVRIHRTLTRHTEHLNLEYMPSLDQQGFREKQVSTGPQSEWDWTAYSHDDLQTGILEAFNRVRREEIQRGITVFGPHRDDIRFSVDDIDLRIYGSRGQNRTAMLAAKIGEVNWIHQRTGEWPVLLLDEVLSELDPERREDMLGRLMDVNQALITSSDLEMFSHTFRDTATIWEMVDGNISKRTF